MPTKIHWDFWDWTDNFRSGREIVKCMHVPPYVWAPISSYTDTYSENKPKTDVKTSYAALTFCLVNKLVKLFSNPYSCKMGVYNTCNTEVTLPNDCCHTSIRQLTRVCPIVWKLSLSYSICVTDWISNNTFLPFSYFSWFRTGSNRSFSFHQSSTFRRDLTTRVLCLTLKREKENF